MISFLDSHLKGFSFLLYVSVASAQTQSLLNRNQNLSKDEKLPDPSFFASGYAVQNQLFGNKEKPFSLFGVSGGYEIPITKDFLYTPELRLDGIHHWDSSKVQPTRMNIVQIDNSFTHTFHEPNFVLSYGMGFGFPCNEDDYRSGFEYNLAFPLVFTLTRSNNTFLFVATYYHYQYKYETADDEGKTFNTRFSIDYFVRWIHTVNKRFRTRLTLGGYDYYLFGGERSIVYNGMASLAYHFRPSYKFVLGVYTDQTVGVSQDFFDGNVAKMKIALEMDF